MYRTGRGELRCPSRSRVQVLSLRILPPPPPLQLSFGPSH